MKELRRIIGIGNRYVPGDAAGPRVCDLLRSGPLPPGVEVVDGGLAGLNLLRFFDDAGRVVLVDQVEGYCRGAGVTVLAEAEVTGRRSVRHGHSAGPAYLIRALRATCTGPGPEVCLVGVEGPPSEGSVAQAARLALELATSQAPLERGAPR